ncbi:MAG: LPS assembly lipoprotein LptE [Pseudomonadota bacterium]
MSSFSRRHVTLGLLAAPLAACGFTPVYAPGGPGTLLRQSVRVEPPETRQEFELVARLEERLGVPSAPSFALTHELSVSQQSVAITGTDDVLRVRINGSVGYALVEAASDAQVLAGRVATFTEYSTFGTTLATDAAERDATDRLMVALADQIVAELLAGATRLL